MRRRAPRIAPASRLAFGSGDTGDRALPGVDRQWRRECDAECRGCAGALLCGGFGGCEVRRGATDPLCVTKAGDAVVAPPYRVRLGCRRGGAAWHQFTRTDASPLWWR